MYSRKELNDRRDFRQSRPENLRRSGGSKKKDKYFVIEIFLQDAWKTRHKYSREDGARQALNGFRNPSSIWAIFKFRLLNDKGIVIA